MDRFSFLNAAHTDFFSDLYEQYLVSPDSVEPSWRAFFQGFDFGTSSYGEDFANEFAQYTNAQMANGQVPDKIQKEFGVLNLIEAYRTRGHLFTKTNPVRDRRVYSPDLNIQQLGFSQDFSRKSVVEFQDKMNAKFRNPETSPLKEEDLETFDGLDFYEISEKYFVKAKFVRTPDEKPFEMPTTTARKPLYVKYGELHFELDGKSCRLDVFQNIELSKKPLYKNSLFLPFTDLTSGEESYGGGRYIDLEIPQGDVIYIDFNKAYNPYCVYNYKYSCPIPPEQNDLPVEIKAGVKKYKD